MAFFKRRSAKEGGDPSGDIQTIADLREQLGAAELRVKALEKELVRQSWAETAEKQLAKIAELQQHAERLAVVVGAARNYSMCQEAIAAYERFTKETELRRTAKEGER